MPFFYWGKIFLKNVLTNENTYVIVELTKGSGQRIFKEGEQMKKNIGKHYIWLSRRLDSVIRTIYQENGRLFMRFEHKTHEVKFVNGEYQADI